MNNKLIRITTVPMALRYLLPGQMRFMKEQGFDVLLVSAAGKELEAVIANEQCPHVIVPMTRKITPLQDLKCLFQLIRIFKKEKPAIIHTHTPKAGLLGMLAAKYCGIKIRIHTVAGLPLMVEKGFKFQLLKFIEKITYAAATQVWPNSYSLLKFIRDNHLTNPGKLKVIGKGSTNGIDLVRFNRNALDEKRLQSTKLAIKYNPEKKYLLCVGRLVADKGIVELVNVFLRIYKKDPSLHLIIAGKYEAALDPLPEATLKTIEGHPSIIHINWTDEVEYYMELSDYFVFPSHREGFPNVLLQAGAMALPIICSRIPGNVDIVNHHETGLIFETGNEAQMEELIVFALSNKGEMELMAAKLHSIIQQDYRRENIWKNILEAYRSLLN